MRKIISENVIACLTREVILKLLAEINDLDLGLPALAVAEWCERSAARAVLIRDSSIALLHVSRFAYYKLPVGGVEPGEDFSSALAREVIEEVGCGAVVKSELGTIIEFRGAFQLKQTSRCFLAEAVGLGTPRFTEEEIANGFILSWTPLAEALQLLEQSTPVDYEGRFIVKRDSIFLRAAQAVLRG